MTDLERAKSLLSENSLAFCRGEFCLTRQGSGIRPLADLLLEKAPLQDCSAADKIVGRAAALLFALAGVREVYAGVLSAGGAEVLASAGIPVRWGQKVPFIVNRRGDGPCPMEQTVAGTDDPQTALLLLRDKLGL